MESIKTVGFVGGGEIGSALAGVFEKEGKKTLIWDIEPDKRTVESFETLVKESDLIVLAVPAKVNREVAKEITKNTSPDKKLLVLSVAKGVEKGFVTVDEVLEQEAQGKFDYGLLYGPMLAHEIASGKGAFAVAGLSNSGWREALKLSVGCKFRIEFGEDLRSITVSGVLKNIYALGLGIADGLDLGFNFKGMMTSKSLQEMGVILKQLNLNPECLHSPAGIPDFFATGWSGESFNYRIGKALAEGILDEEHAKGEGVNAVREIEAKVDLNETLILAAIRNIVINNGRVEEFERVVG